jgi:hypothetical protein
VEAKAAVPDDDVGPNAFEQLTLGHDSPALLDKRCQEVERAPSDFNRHVVPCEQALAPRKAKWTKSEHLS